MKNESLKHFMSVCEREFRYLIDDFGFSQSPLPEGKYLNQFQFRLSNGSITLVVEGINWGMNAMVLLEDKFGRSVGIGCLLPGWEPFTKQKGTRKKKQPNQDQQIEEAAKLLKTNGQDVLGGDLERFNKIGDRINNIRGKPQGSEINI